MTKLHKSRTRFARSIFGARRQFEQLYNILQEWRDGAAQTMLGCNVPRDVAETYYRKYVDGLPETNRRRAANGVGPLEVVYSIITAEGPYADWFPVELRGFQ